MRFRQKLLGDPSRDSFEGAVNVVVAARLTSRAHRVFKERYERSNRLLCPGSSTVHWHVPRSCKKMGKIEFGSGIGCVLLLTPKAWLEA
jgi:hypothetical protein